MGKLSSFLIGSVVNILAPIGILVLLSDQIGPIWALSLSILIPLIYGVIVMMRDRRSNLTLVLSMVGVLIVIGVFFRELDPRWVAIKEAAFPALIGIGLLIAELFGLPLASGIFVRSLQHEKIEKAAIKKGVATRYRRLGKLAAYALAGVFLISAIVDYIIARRIVVSSPGTTAFNRELATMEGLGLLFILVPSVIAILGIELWYIYAVRRLTFLSLSEVLKGQEKEA